MSSQDSQVPAKQEEKKKNQQIQKNDNYKEDLPQLIQPGNLVDPITISKKREMYDFVKIKVRLNEHYYIFSRFLISRMLMLCRIPKLQAEKIAKDVKKYLVEQRKYEIDQKDLEAILFQQINQNQYSEVFIHRYQMTSEFFRKRVPLIIFIFGPPRIRKSIVATHLAEKLNISNVLPTAIVKMTMNILDQNSFSDSHQLNFSEAVDEAQVIETYKQHAQKIKKGIINDITKTLQEGKPIIIEGYELIPDLYLKINRSPSEQERIQSERLQKQNLLMNYLQNKGDVKKEIQDLQTYNISNHINDIFFIKISGQNGGNAQLTEKDQTKQSQIEQTLALIVPILLVINQRDHKYSIENHTSIQAIQDKEARQQAIKNCQKNYNHVQNHLIQQADLCTICPINYHYPEETINVIHDIVLQKIETMYKNKLF